MYFATIMPVRNIDHPFMDNGRHRLDTPGHGDKNVRIEVPTDASSGLTIACSKRPIFATGLSILRNRDHSIE